MSQTPSQNRERLKSFWLASNRSFALEGELVASLLRCLLVVAFYATELIHFLSLQNASLAEKEFHSTVTGVAAVWMLLSLGALIAINKGWYVNQLKYVATAVDLILLTGIAAIGNNTSSPLVVLFGLVIALAGLRMNGLLVWFATIGSMLGYIVLMGVRDKQWFDANHETPLLSAMVVLLSLVSTGIVIDQLVRIVRHVVSDLLLNESARASMHGGSSNE